MQFLYHKYVLGTTSLIIHISPILKFSCGNFNKHLNSYGNINDDSALSSSAYRREQLSGCWHWVAANILLVAPFFFCFFLCVFFWGFFFQSKRLLRKKVSRSDLPQKCTRWSPWGPSSPSCKTKTSHYVQETLDIPLTLSKCWKLHWAAASLSLTRHFFR